MTEAAVDPAGDTRGTAVNGRAAVVTLTYLGFTLQLLQVGIVPLLPTIGKQLHLGVADTSWLVTSSLLAGAVALAVISRLADLYGKKPMIMVSLALVLAGCLIDCFATSFPLLILGRVLMGAQFPMLALPEAIASDTMPKKRAQLTIGAIHAGNGVGVGIGGGILLGALVGIHPTAWRSFFVIGIITVVIGMAATGWLVRDSRHRAAGRLDLTGAVLLALSLVGILLGLSKGPTWGWGSPRVVALLVAGVVLLLLLAGFGRAGEESADPAERHSEAARESAVSHDIPHRLRCLRLALRGHQAGADPAGGGRFRLRIHDPADRVVRGPADNRRHRGDNVAPAADQARQHGGVRVCGRRPQCPVICGLRGARRRPDRRFDRTGRLFDGHRDRARHHPDPHCRRGAGVRVRGRAGDLHCRVRGGKLLRQRHRRPAAERLRRRRRRSHRDRFSGQLLGCCGASLLALAIGGSLAVRSRISGAAAHAAG
ncbi:MFS transporter [Fodinicola feengrottensis]|uniref:MFS transporter n=1 Tax=Fodinicola feengrottensis TaxID=435914 RepID=UPI0013D8297A|nr:MFS transporter [Fodinicola feengrottensis]